MKIEKIDHICFAVKDLEDTKRVYKDAFPQEKCVAIISEGRGTQFDPIIVDAFLETVETFDKIRKEFSENIEVPAFGE